MFSDGNSVFWGGNITVLANLIAGNRVEIQAWRNAGPTWTLSRILGYFGGVASRIHMIKVG